MGDFSYGNSRVGEVEPAPAATPAKRTRKPKAATGESGKPTDQSSAPKPGAKETAKSKGLAAKAGGFIRKAQGDRQGSAVHRLGFLSLRLPDE
jgi:hypothetical protein